LACLLSITAYFFCRICTPPRSTLFPYTTLFRSLVQERYRIDFSDWEQVTPRALARRWDERWHQVVVPQLLRDLTESEPARRTLEDRKSTRLNSSHVAISYAVFCLKKKKNIHASK